MQESRSDVLAWLRQKPSLAELRDAFPSEWEAVQRDLAEIVARGDLEEFKAYVLRLSQPPSAVASGRARRKRGRDPLVQTQVRRQIAAEALRQLCLTTAARAPTGRVRFNLLNGYVAQRLLFAQDLERKPVSLFWFSLAWPLLWQRRFLMPLVGRKGIYCFYSGRLIKRLAAMIGDRSCLEIAAGDGTLSRLLGGEGVQVTATDDYSWQNVQYQDAVLRQDARAALRAHQPEVVVCSWPPAGNPFERHVFKTSSVELYVVISSRHQFASGNWVAYEQQDDFAFAEDPALSRLVLPPELEAAVYVFRRARHPG